MAVGKTCSFIDESKSGDGCNRDKEERERHEAFKKHRQQATGKRIKAKRNQGGKVNREKLERGNCMPGLRWKENFQQATGLNGSKKKNQRTEEATRLEEIKLVDI